MSHPVEPANSPTDVSAETSPRRSRPGGRSTRVVQAVLAATLEELGAVGYAALSFDAVAERAGVNRTTVYRRWPTRAGLVRAAFAALADRRRPPPDTGSLRSDLLEVLLQRLGTQSVRDLRLLRAVMGELANPEVAALARVIATSHEASLVTLVARAVERGELPRGTEPRLVFEPILSTVFLRASLFGEPPSPAYVEQLVDLVLAGARAGAALPSPPA